MDLELVLESTKIINPRQRRQKLIVTISNIAPASNYRIYRSIDRDRITRTDVLVNSNTRSKSHKDRKESIFGVLMIYIKES